MENSEDIYAVPEDPPNIPFKRRGDIAELAFMFKAVSMGFGVAKPWGDNDRYDVILSTSHSFLRVQIKSVWARRYYVVKTSGYKAVPYTPDEIDFLVAYITPRNIWYVIPVAVIGSRVSLYLRPFQATCPYEQYRDAWQLFGETLRAPSSSRASSGGQGEEGVLGII